MKLKEKVLKCVSVVVDKAIEASIDSKSLTYFYEPELPAKLKAKK